MSFAVLRGIRIRGFHARKESIFSPHFFGCLLLALYGIKALALQPSTLFLTWEGFYQTIPFQRGHAEDQCRAQLLHRDLHRIKERRGSHRVQDVEREVPLASPDRQTFLSSHFPQLRRSSGWTFQSQTLSRCLTTVIVVIGFKIQHKIFTSREKKKSSWN